MILEVQVREDYGGPCNYGGGGYPDYHQADGLTL